MLNTFLVDGPGSTSPAIQDGVIRCDGRFKIAELLPYNTKCPIILPRRPWVTKLIVKNCHERGNRAVGENFILCQLSERFWIIAAREEIREWDHEFNECKKRRNKPACQIMVPLPKARQRFTFQPFAQTAMDFPSPLYTVQGHRKPRQKRWLCQFNLLWSKSSAFIVGMKTRYWYVLERLHIFYLSPWSSKGGDKWKRHKFPRCSGRVKETSQPVRQTETWEQDSRAWSNMEIQPTSCFTFWRSLRSDGERKHLRRCTRVRFDRWGADYSVWQGGVSP